jgi:exonuclease III
MNNYSLNILGICESQWTGSGKKRLVSGETLLFSGHEEEDAPHTQGVALMLSKTAERALIGWKAHGLRIMAASFKTKKRRLNLNIIQVYAPTNKSDEADKEDFYNIVEKYQSRDLNIVMGDLNA